ncbi:hypothetical protein [Alkalihalobacterium chitinilyticum]|uniref:ABC transporter ATPase n=1 Tax=Alkalihalobacterium chitinilyticum TaxID=2980103 RepID=A0ABT5VIF2_9BACI|nr:hypothetical protein [Alkalihalobacterium chitinilyticum]MDE5415234.1 hypothetical protein [Alkalihalobacterium chitinilyticum]
MLKNPSEKDFVVLRDPLKSGRQAPGSLAGAMMIGGFCQGLMVYFTHDIGRDSKLPFTNYLVNIHLWVTVILIALTIVFLVPYIYINFQKTQYLISILVIQNLMTFSWYVLALLIIGASIPYDSRLENVMTYIYITLIVGILLFIVTCIRFYILLIKGKYREGSSRDQLRQKFEGRLNMSAIIAGSVGFGFIMQYVIRTLDFVNSGDVLIVAIGLLIFYTMIFILPEQLVILYCKYRFKSFNYRVSGKRLILNSLQETEEDEEFSLTK